MNETIARSQYFRTFYLGAINESNPYDNVVKIVKENLNNLVSKYGKCATINIIKSQLAEFYVNDDAYTTQYMINEIFNEINEEESFKRKISSDISVNQTENKCELTCQTKKYTLNDALSAHKTAIIIKEIEKLYDIIFDEVEYARYSKFIDELRRKKPTASIVKINIKAEYEDNECIFAEPEGYQHGYFMYDYNALRIFSDDIWLGMELTGDMNTFDSLCVCIFYMIE